MKWLKNITPLVITAIGFAFILIYYMLDNNAAEVKSSIAFIALPLIGGCIIVDIIIKRGFKWKVLQIWIVEIILLLIVVYLWIIAE
jgi:hypothetical protein